MERLGVLSERDLGTPEAKTPYARVIAVPEVTDMAQEWEEIVWTRLSQFERENPTLVEAMRALNITREEYFRILAALTQQRSNVSNTST
jgi:hypothetical protein